MAAMAAYHVIQGAITTETQLNPAGTGIVDVHVIPYEIDSGPARGNRRTVKVTQADWSREGVQKAIEADLAVTHSVASLGQGS